MAGIIILAMPVVAMTIMIIILAVGIAKIDKREK